MAKICAPREQILKALAHGKRELTLVQIREACGVMCPVIACQHWYSFMKKLQAEGLVTIHTYEGAKEYMYALATKTKVGAKTTAKKAKTKVAKTKVNKSSKAIS